MIHSQQYVDNLLINKREVNKMKEKYVIYYDHDNTETVIMMTEEQAKAIKWFMDEFSIDGTIETIENYEAREI